LRRALHHQSVDLKNLATSVVDNVRKLRAWYGARHEAFTVAQAAQAARLSHEAARRLCAVDANVGKLRRLSEGVYVKAV
jgi:hypothetical protein